MFYDNDCDIYCVVNCECGENSILDIIMMYLGFNIWFMVKGFLSLIFIK